VKSDEESLLLLEFVFELESEDVLQSENLRLLEVEEQSEVLYQQCPVEPVDPVEATTQTLFTHELVEQSLLDVQTFPTIALQMLLTQVKPTSQGHVWPEVPNLKLHIPFKQICPVAHSEAAEHTPPYATLQTPPVAPRDVEHTNPELQSKVVRQDSFNLALLGQFCVCLTNNHIVNAIKIKRTITIIKK
jgi:hypothetical protein